MGAVLKIGGTEKDLDRLLSDPDRLKEVAEIIIRPPAIPTEMMLDGEIFDILPLLRDSDPELLGVDIVVARAQEMRAHQGKEIRLKFLAPQAVVIHPALRELVFVFTNDRRESGREGFNSAVWSRAQGCWITATEPWLGYDSRRRARVLRRRLPPA